MRFWDASAIVPLLCRQPESAAVEALLAEDDAVIVWWATRVECVSAISRLEREGTMAAQTASAILHGITALSETWSEVVPGEVVRERAVLLLRRHPLRAADALQLSAALSWSDGLPQGAEVVALDDRLRDAAAREGFVVLP